MRPEMGRRLAVAKPWRHHVERRDSPIERRRELSYGPSSYRARVTKCCVHGPPLGLGTLLPHVPKVTRKQLPRTPFIPLSEVNNPPWARESWSIPSHLPRLNGRTGCRSAAFQHGAGRSRTNVRLQTCGIGEPTQTMPDWMMADLALDVWLSHDNVHDGLPCPRDGHDGAGIDSMVSGPND